VPGVQALPAPQIQVAEEVADRAWLMPREAQAARE